MKCFVVLNYSLYFDENSRNDDSANEEKSKRDTVCRWRAASFRCTHAQIKLVTRVVNSDDTDKGNANVEYTNDEK